MTRTTILIVVLILILGILVLCAYKVYAWYQKELKNKFPLIEEEKKKYITYDIRQRIFRIRNRTSIALSVVLILIVFLNVCFMSKNHIAAGALFGLALSFIIFNNMVVSKLWLCPFCQNKLPVKVKKGGAVPKSVDICPHCNKELKYAANTNR